MSTPTTPTAIPSTKERYDRYQQALSAELGKVEQLEQSLEAARINAERLRGVLYALGEEMKFDDQATGDTAPS